MERVEYSTKSFFNLKKMIIQTTPTGLTILLEKVDQTNELTITKGNDQVKIKRTDLELKYLGLVISQDNEE